MWESNHLNHATGSPSLSIPSPSHPPPTPSFHSADFPRPFADHFPLPPHNRSSIPFHACPPICALRSQPAARPSPASRLCGCDPVQHSPKPPFSAVKLCSTALRAPHPHQVGASPPYASGFGAAGVSPWRNITAIIFALSGGPPPAAFTTSAASRKYSGPIAAGVTTHSTFASWLP